MRHQFAVVWVVFFSYKAADQAHGLVDAAPLGVFVPTADVLGVVEVEPVFGEQPHVQAELAQGFVVGLDDTFVAQFDKDFHQKRGDFHMGEFVVFAQKLLAADEKGVYVAE